MVESFLISDTLQTFLVGLLRYAFSFNSTYTYDTNKNLTKIFIQREYPKVLTSHPVVLIHTPTIDDIPRYFGSDILKEVHGIVTYNGLTFENGLCYQVFGGNFSTGISISVFANTSTERERVVDWIITYLRYTYRSYLESRSIDILNIRRDGSSAEVYGSELVYSNEISMNLYGEWSNTVYPDNGSGILSKIYISGSSYITADGLTYPDMYTSVGDI